VIVTASRDVDVVVLGTGAAGLAAAVAAHDGGAEVLVLEKADLVGGTTGVSGGMPWVPCNRHMAELGIADSREEAVAYLERLTLGRAPDPTLLAHYVDHAAEAVEYLEDHTPLRMSAPPGFSDYYADQVGGKPGGRSLEPGPFDARTALGAWAPRLRTSPFMPRLTMAEGAKFQLGQPVDLSVIAEREANDIRVLGPGLVAALFKGLLDRGVTTLTGARATELTTIDGAVTGLHAQTADGDLEVRARKGVVLACGGFEWNRDMVAAFIGRKLVPLSPPHNTGDGHAMAMRVGAQLGNMYASWGQPAVNDPNVTYEGRPLYQFEMLRNAAGTIMVNRHGRRFGNEGVAYNDMTKAFGAYDPVTIDYPNAGPAWLVFDQHFRERMPILSVMPGDPVPEWLACAPSIRELAEAVDVDGLALEQTVAQWNDHAQAGHDPDFHRGTVWWESFTTGGPSARKCIGPIRTPPFYALPIHDGTLGTSGGMRITADAEVLDTDGTVIPGLYAAGNASACVFGPMYPGAGATIGPALTFGVLAGRHAATQEPR
jgi:succinate dehydrogenase/fumarate reductase flavoprotein subunit